MYLRVKQELLQCEQRLAAAAFVEQDRTAPSENSNRGCVKEDVADNDLAEGNQVHTTVNYFNDVEEDMALLSQVCGLERILPLKQIILLVSQLSFL